MGKCTYAKPDTETRALLEQVMQAYHPELEQAQVRVGITMVYPPTNKDGEPTRHALTRHGARCLARIHLVSLAKRVYVPVDAMIEIDAEHWENILAPARKAILDHELTHIVVRYQKGKGVVTAGEDGTPESVRRLPKLDQDDRPMLGLKPDDYAITGFYAVAERHGEESAEVQSMRAIWDKHGQAMFPWARGMMGGRKKKAG